ncbi:MAG: flippase [Pseudomonadota bacterium]
MLSHLKAVTERLRGSTARSTLVTFVSMVLPLATGFFAIPPLIESLGDERFGLLAIVWLVLGYFSVFDLGLGRAVSFAVSERIGSQKRSSADTRDILTTSVPLLLGFGSIGGGVLLVFAEAISTRLLNVSVDLQSDTTSALFIAALGLPLVTCATGLRGYLEGHQHFGKVAIVRSLIGSLVFLSPLFVLPFTEDLSHIVFALVLTKVLSVIIYGALSLRIEFSGSQLPAFRLALARRLLRFGGWLTVSNIVSPIMVVMDRFLIGSILTVSLVTYYVTPFEVVSKLLVFATAVATVAFPKLTRQIAEQKPGVHRAVLSGTAVIGLAMFPAVAFFVFFGEVFLSWWISEELAAKSGTVMQILAVGILVNSLAYLPFVAIQSANRPDITAKIHLLELPIYVLSILWLTKNMGIVGTAIAWTARVTLDTILMHFMASRVLRR